MRQIAMWMLPAALAVMTGCPATGDSGDDEPVCEEDKECQIFQGAVSGGELDECEANGDCAAGEACISVFDGRAGCMVLEGTGCATADAAYETDDVDGATVSVCLELAGVCDDDGTCSEG